MTKEVNERELVLGILMEVTKEGEYSHIVLRNVLNKYQYLEKKERAFITRLTEGTLERMIELDYIIDQFSKVKVKKMKPVIRNILRSAVYQLKYMDNVPNSAACNEAVKLAVRKGFASLKGFVNGVLRNISRGLLDVEYPSREENVEEYISVKYSLPMWIVRQWMESYDVETIEKMGKEFLKEKPTSIRCNLNKISREELKSMLEEEGVSVEVVEELPYALAISEYDFLGKLKSFQSGYFSVQDISSMQVAHWADPQDGDMIIDVCAAPGGKSIHMAELLKGTGHVQARDLTDYKVGLIQENIFRSGLTNIDAVQWDATILREESIEKADIVIADLPCSGLGVFGKKTDLKYKITEAMQNDLVKLQREMLSVVNNYVKPGGKLLYSTCTIHKAENEENTAWFLKNHPEFKLVKEKQMLPGIDGGDGFYIAMLVKENHE